MCVFFTLKCPCNRCSHVQSSKAQLSSCEISWFSPRRAGCDAPSRAVLTAGIPEQLHQFHGTWICEV